MHPGMHACMQDPGKAMREHSGWAQLFSADPYAAGFGEGAVSHLIDVATENQKQAGIHVVEVGAGSGAFTRQASAPVIWPSPAPAVHSKQGPGSPSLPPLLTPNWQPEGQPSGIL